MRDSRDHEQFHDEFRRMTREMQEHMTEIEGDAVIMAMVAMAYSLRSLHMQGYSPQQIDDLVRVLMKRPRVN